MSGLMDLNGALAALRRRRRRTLSWDLVDVWTFRFFTTAPGWLKAQTLADSVQATHRSHIYLVPSQSSSKPRVVDLNAGLCDCPNSAALCSHICAAVLAKLSGRDSAAHLIALARTCRLRELLDGRTDSFSLPEVVRQLLQETGDMCNPALAAETFLLALVTNMARCSPALPLASALFPPNHDQPNVSDNDDDDDNDNDAELQEGEAIDLPFEATRSFKFVVPTNATVAAHVDSTLNDVAFRNGKVPPLLCTDTAGSFDYDHDLMLLESLWTERKLDGLVKHIVVMSRRYKQVADARRRDVRHIVGPDLLQTTGYRSGEKRSPSREPDVQPDVALLLELAMLPYCDLLAAVRWLHIGADEHWFHQLWKSLPPSLRARPKIKSTFLLWLDANGLNADRFPDMMTVDNMRKRHCQEGSSRDSTFGSQAERAISESGLEESDSESQMIIEGDGVDASITQARKGSSIYIGSSDEDDNDEKEALSVSSSAGRSLRADKASNRRSKYRHATESQCQACLAPVDENARMFCLAAMSPVAHLHAQRVATYWDVLFCEDVEVDENAPQKSEWPTALRCVRAKDDAMHLTIGVPKGPYQHVYDARSLLAHVTRTNALGQTPEKSAAFWSMCFHSRSKLEKAVMREFFDFPVYVWNLARRKAKFVVYAKEIMLLSQVNNPFLLFSSVNCDVTQHTSLGIYGNNLEVVKSLGKLLQHGVSTSLKLVTFISPHVWSTDPAMTYVLEYVCETLSLAALHPHEIQDMSTVHLAASAPLLNPYYPNDTLLFNTFELLQPFLQASQLPDFWFTQEPSCLGPLPADEDRVVRRSDGVVKVRGCYCNAHPKYKLSKLFIETYPVCPLWINGCKDLQTGEVVHCAVCRDELQSEAVEPETLVEHSWALPNCEEPGANFGRVIDHLLEQPQLGRSLEEWCLAQQTQLAELLIYVKPWLTMQKGFRGVAKKYARVRVLDPNGLSTSIKKLSDMAQDQLLVPKLAVLFQREGIGSAILPTAESLIDYMLTLKPADPGVYDAWSNAMKQLIIHLDTNPEDLHMLERFPSLLVRDIKGNVKQRLAADIVVNVPVWMAQCKLLPGLIPDNQFQLYREFYATHLHVNRYPNATWARHILGRAFTIYFKQMWPEVDALLQDADPDALLTKILDYDTREAEKISAQLNQIFILLNTCVVAHDYLLVDPAGPDTDESFFLSYLSKTHRAQVREEMKKFADFALPILPVKSARFALSRTGSGTIIVERFVPLSVAPTLIYGYGARYEDWLVEMQVKDTRAFVIAEWAPELQEHWASFCHTLGARWWETALNHLPECDPGDIHNVVIEFELLDYLVESLKHPRPYMYTDEDAERVFGTDLNRLVRVVEHETVPYTNSDADLPRISIKVLDRGGANTPLSTHSFIDLQSHKFEYKMGNVTTPIIQYTDVNLVEILVPVAMMTPTIILETLLSHAGLLTLSAFINGQPRLDAVEAILRTWKRASLILPVPDSDSVTSSPSPRVDRMTVKPAPWYENVRTEDMLLPPDMLAEMQSTDLQVPTALQVPVPMPASAGESSKKESSKKSDSAPYITTTKMTQPGTKSLQLEDYEGDSKRRIGFKGERVVCEYLEEELAGTDYSVRWTNKTTETMKPYDAVILDSEGEVLQYVEIKTSARQGNNEFYLSINELEFAKQQRERYCILYITGINSTSPNIQKMQNPYNLLKLKKLDLCVKIPRDGS